MSHIIGNACVYIIHVTKNHSNERNRDDSNSRMKINALNIIFQYKVYLDETNLF